MGMGVTLDGYRTSFQDDDNILKQIVMMATQF